MPSAIQFLCLCPANALRPAGRRLEPQRPDRRRGLCSGSLRLPACPARLGCVRDRWHRQRPFPRGRRAGRAQRQPGAGRRPGHLRLPRRPGTVLWRHPGPGGPAINLDPSGSASPSRPGHPVGRPADLREPFQRQRPVDLSLPSGSWRLAALADGGGGPALLHGFNQALPWKGEGHWALIVTLALVLGKAAGGFLCDAMALAGPQSSLWDWRRSAICSPRCLCWARLQCSYST